MHLAPLHRKQGKAQSTLNSVGSDTTAGVVGAGCNEDIEGEAEGEDVGNVGDLGIDEEVADVCTVGVVGDRVSKGEVGIEDKLEVEVVANVGAVGFLGIDDEVGDVCTVGVVGDRVSKGEGVDIEDEVEVEVVDNVGVGFGVGCFLVIAT